MTRYRKLTREVREKLEDAVWTWRTEKMKLVHTGSRGADVRLLQMSLNAQGAKLTVDGVFGDDTERAVAQFQEKHGLYADGVVGQLTWDALLIQTPIGEVEAARFTFARGKLRYPRGGEAQITLRSDILPIFRDLDNQLANAGSGLTSSGGRRLVSATVSSTRSPTSMHYLGLAFDLWVGAAMDSPKTDAYVVVRDETRSRFWRVFARLTDAGAKATALPVVEQNLLAVRTGRAPLPVSGMFVDLTTLLEAHGFRPIPSQIMAWDRLERPDGSNYYGGSEWWHFQHDTSLTDGQTFGSALLEVYAATEIAGTSLWAYRDYEFNRDRRGFVR